ncbi:MAG TPA: hypothetical protein VIV11_38435 [Kofleriaceae bacterium]
MFDTINLEALAHITGGCADGSCGCGSGGCSCGCGSATRSDHATGSVTGQRPNVATGSTEGVLPLLQTNRPAAGTR